MDQENMPTEGETQAVDEMENIDFGDDDQSSESSEELKTQTPEEFEQKEKPETYINQEAVNKRINEITFAKHEERRKREQVESELAELKAKLEADAVKEIGIEIPPLPDIYADDYHEKIKERDIALQKASAALAKKEFLEEQNQKIITQKLQEQRQNLQRRVEDMYAKAKDYGISHEDMLDADNKVGAFIKNPDLATFILDQKDSALIVKYLSSDAEELEKLSTMSPLQASVRIVTEISKKALGLKPGVTRTPPPVEIPKSKMRTENNKFLKGVTFE